MRDFIEYGNECLLNLRLNDKLAEEKQLTYNNYEMYYRIQSLYKKVFEYKINQLINLIELNDRLKKSELDFGLLPDNKRNYYHKISYLNLDYIYIQNFLFIEKLKAEYLNVFKERVLANDYKIDAVLLNIVDETFREIMKANYYSDGYSNEQRIVCYGSENPANHFYNDSLIIRIEYGRNTVKLTNEDFLINYNKKKELLDTIIKELKDRGLKNNINIETTIVKIM